MWTCRPVEYAVADIRQGVVLWLVVLGVGLTTLRREMFRITKPQGMRRIWLDNIMMDLREVSCEDESGSPAQDRVQWLALALAVLTLRL